MPPTSSPSPASAKAQSTDAIEAEFVRYDVATARLLLELPTGYLIGIPVEALSALDRVAHEVVTSVSLSPGGKSIRFDGIDTEFDIAELIQGSCRGMSGRPLVQRAGRIGAASSTSTKEEAVAEVVRAIRAHPNLTHHEVTASVFNAAAAAQENGMTPEELVDALRLAWRGPGFEAVDPQEDPRYWELVAWLLDAYFGDAPWRVSDTARSA